MKSNPPITFVSLLFTIINVLFKNGAFMIPMSVGTLISGTIMSEIYPDGLAKKYEKSVNFVRTFDILAHWLPTLLLLYVYRDSKFSVNATLFAIIFPVFYFSFNIPEVKAINPFIHVENIYPGVPLYIFLFYILGAIVASSRV